MPKAKTRYDIQVVLDGCTMRWQSWKADLTPDQVVENLGKIVEQLKKASAIDKVESAKWRDAPDPPVPLPEGR
jgi:hypothetical protein